MTGCIITPPIRFPWYYTLLSLMTVSLFLNLSGNYYWGYLWWWDVLCKGCILQPWLCMYSCFRTETNAGCWGVSVCDGGRSEKHAIHSLICQFWDITMLIEAGAQGKRLCAIILLRAFTFTCCSCLKSCYTPGRTMRSSFYQQSLTFCIIPLL